MSSSRAQTNQALYLAKIVLQSWSDALAAQQISAVTAHQAFAPAVGEHLQVAYGWFLLELADQEVQGSGVLPKRCQDLSPPAEGRALPGELREMAQLERSGFLAALIEQPGPLAVRTSGKGNLAAASIEGPDYHEMCDLVEKIGALCERMRNSLDEY